jgi:CBS domain-containing protein
MEDSYRATPREPTRQATVRDRMHPAVTVELHAHVAAAAYLMQRAHATALVVITNDAKRWPVATISDTDIAQAVGAGGDIDEMHVDELVGPQPVTLRPDMAVSEAVALMASAGARHLPVVENGRLIGMLDLIGVPAQR